MTSKYLNKPAEVEGITFHSKREAARYKDLRLAEKAGTIRALNLQVKFPLYCTSTDDPLGALVAVYVADFTYGELGVDGVWRFVVEDCKGMRTAVYKLKRKWLLLQEGIEIRET